MLPQAEALKSKLMSLASGCQAGVEFAFAQGQDAGADFEGLFFVAGVAFGGFQFRSGAAAFFECLKRKNSKGPESAKAQLDDTRLSNLHSAGVL